MIGKRPYSLEPHTNEAIVLFSDEATVEEVMKSFQNHVINSLLHRLSLDLSRVEEIMKCKPNHVINSVNSLLLSLSLGLSRAHTINGSQVKASKYQRPNLVPWVSHLPAP